MDFLDEDGQVIDRRNITDATLDLHIVDPVIDSVPHKSIVFLRGSEFFPRPAEAPPNAPFMSYIAEFDEPVTCDITQLADPKRVNVTCQAGL